MKNNILRYFYTLQEIAEAINCSEEEKREISFYSRFRNLDEIVNHVPILGKFKKYIQKVKVQGKEIFVINSKIFDSYMSTGILKDVGDDINETSTSKKEYWQYTPSSTYEMTTKDEWGFALDYFKSKDENIEEEDIWNIFLAGNARMDYLQDSKTTISQRIKYAIMEYMMRRPQIFYSSDFLDLREKKEVK